MQIFDDSEICREGRRKMEERAHGSQSVVRTHTHTHTYTHTLRRVWQWRSTAAGPAISWADTKWQGSCSCHRLEHTTTPGLIKLQPLHGLINHLMMSYHGDCWAATTDRNWSTMCLSVLTHTRAPTCARTHGFPRRYTHKNSRAWEV